MGKKTKGIQTKTLLKLIVLTKAWIEGDLSFRRKQFLTLYKIKEILGCSERTAWDYYTALSKILDLIGIFPLTRSLQCDIMEKTVKIKVPRDIDFTNPSNFTEKYSWLSEDELESDTLDEIQKFLGSSGPGSQK